MTHDVLTDVEMQPTKQTRSEQDAKLEGEASKHLEGNNEYTTGLPLFVVVVVTTTVMLLATLDISILSTAIPQITSDFHRLEDVGWYSGAYLLASSTVQPLSGKLYTYFSSKWTFLAFTVLFEIGSLICGLATSSSMFIAGRVVAGFGGSGLFNGTITVVAGAVPLPKRPLYMGIMIGIGQIGVVLGPLLGGAFTEHATWRWCFYINLPLGGLTAILLAFIHVPDQVVKEPFSLPLVRKLLPQLDLPGFALFAPAATTFLLALHLGSSSHGGAGDGGSSWGSATVIGLFCGSAAASVTFFLWERRAGNSAMIPGSVVRQTVVWASSLQFSFLMGVTFVTSVFIPIYFQAVVGLGAMLSGVYMLPGILSQIVFVMLSGALVTKYGYYSPWAIFAGVGGAIACGLLSTWSQDTGLGKQVGYQILLGIKGAGAQIGIIAIQHALPPAQSAIGVAFLIFTQNMWGAVLTVVANTLFQTRLVSELAVSAPSIAPAAAIAAGGSAANVRDLLPTGSPEMEGLLQAYASGVTAALYLSTAIAVASALAVAGMGWTGWSDVRVKANEKEEEDKEQSCPG